VTFRGPGPWLASAALHVAVGTLAALLWLQEAPQPPALKMRLLSASGGAKASVPTTNGSWVPPVPRGARALTEPTLPGWQATVPAQMGEPSGIPAPASLAELLGPEEVRPADEPAALAPVVSVGWSGTGGMGYSPPPLPPPGLSPPQGSQWTLSLSIPGGGGFARSLEGLDSGHPELDLWLEKYLRTVSFPSSPDGEDYQVRWTLRLESGRPE